MLGRPLEIVSRDDGGNPGNALTAANELAARENVALLIGTFLSHVGLAVSDFARQKKMLFIAAEPLSDALTWEKGNRYTFRLRPSVYMQAGMLAEEAAKMPAKRWASVAPNYEYGKSAVGAFREIMARKRPDVEWVAEQWPTLNKIDAGPTVQALARPEAIFNVTFAADLSQFVREGATRGLFRDRKVVSLLTGEPEYLDLLKVEAPTGWLVTGYPWHAIDTPEHKAFLEAYLAKFNDYPRLASVVGYATLKAVAAILAKAGSTDAEKMVAAAEGVGVDTPFGPSPSASPTINRRWAPTSAAPHSRTARASWPIGTMPTAPTTCRRRKRSRSCVHRISTPNWTYYILSNAPLHRRRHA